MTFLRKLQDEPWRFDYFAVLRQLERTFKDQPRIGDSAASREEFVRLGQDPFMAFPASNLARVAQARQQTAPDLRQVSRPPRTAGRPATRDHRRGVPLHACRR